MRETAKRAWWIVKPPGWDATSQAVRSSSRTYAASKLWPNEIVRLGAVTAAATGRACG